MSYPSICVVERATDTKSVQVNSTKVKQSESFRPSSKGCCLRAKSNALETKRAVKRQTICSTTICRYLIANWAIYITHRTLVSARPLPRAGRPRQSRAAPLRRQNDSARDLVFAALSTMQQPIVLHLSSYNGLSRSKPSIWKQWLLEVMAS